METKGTKIVGTFMRDRVSVTPFRLTMKEGLAAVIQDLKMPVHLSRAMEVSY